MSFNLDSITSGVSEFAKGAVSKVGNLLDPSNARLSIAGLLQGGRRKTEKTPETRVGFAVANPKGEPIPIQKDWRVRISLPASSQMFYNSSEAGILAPLKDTNGVVFPYTPSITTSYSASYGQLKTTHSNYPAYFYESSEVQAIQLSGDFTVQNVKEGQYLLASIYFFRACTKMFYGASSKAGNPPLIVFLNGYGSELLPNVPCVVTGFQQVMPAEVDYVQIPSLNAESSYATNEETGETYYRGEGPSTRLPTSCQLQITLQPVYSRAILAEFDLEKFAAGRMLDKGYL
jgi:hypothetical protein